MAKYNIGGYIFSDEESAKKAAKELKTVEYILGQLKDADEKTVLQIYNKLLKQKLFSTEIGLGFLSQLRQNLIASGAFSEAEVDQVYSTKEPEEEKEVETEKPVAKTSDSKKKEVTESSQVKKLKIINSILVVISVTLLLCVIGMFYISSTMREL